MKHHLHSRRSRLAARLGATFACGLVASAAAPATVGAAVPSGQGRPPVAAAVHHPAAPAKASGNVCHKNKIDVPKCGVLWGLYEPGVKTPLGYRAPYRTIEKAIGRRLDLLKTYVDWAPGDGFPSATLASLARSGKRVLDVSWNAVTYHPRGKVSYASIASGEWDKSVILPEARRLKAFHRKIFVDFDHEFDNKQQAGKGTPAQYVAAYRHIHHVFAAAGVKNVIWAWVSTGDIYHAAQLKASYPGRKYVNWIGYDPYNWASCRSQHWDTPYQTFHPFYRWVSHQPGMKHKPLMLGEYGSVPGPLVESWFSHIPRALKHLHRIKALMEFSSGSPPCDFRLSSSPAAMAGFAIAANSRFVTGVRH
jgi:hypothetical protein